MERDIFEDMRAKVGCMYISDLSSSKDKVKKELLEFIVRSIFRRTSF
jgi:hypothetical protein